MLTNLKLEYVKELFIEEYGNLFADIMTLYYNKNEINYKIWKIKDKYFIYKSETNEV